MFTAKSWQQCFRRFNNCDSGIIAHVAMQFFVTNGDWKKYVFSTYSRPMPNWHICHCYDCSPLLVLQCSPQVSSEWSLHWEIGGPGLPQEGDWEEAETHRSKHSCFFLGSGCPSAANMALSNTVNSPSYSVVKNNKRSHVTLAENVASLHTGLFWTFQWSNWSGQK